MKYNKNISGIAFIALISIYAQCNKPANTGSSRSKPQVYREQLHIWLTKADSSTLLQKQTNNIFFDTGLNNNPVIEVNDTQAYQTIDGFGYTLTGGSAMLIQQMDAASRAALLANLFGNGDNAIGISYIRLSMGASDLDATVFSYNDLPAGQTDISQNKFSITVDKTNLIPLLKSILAIHPNIKIIATPWSPPTWMKDNNNSKGGSLQPEWYGSYATYFVKYIQAMKAEGIAIDAITPQNEPLHPGNNPSLLMLPEQQLVFIKTHLGPAFKAAGIATKIVVYDHNLDRPDYPLTILNDTEANQYVDGSAFHLYAGDISAMARVHDAYPSKNLYFTEQWTGAKSGFGEDLKWHIKNVIIGSMRNWSKIALEWNLANDPSFGPHTPGGCTECKGAVTISGSTITKNVAYYIIAHAAKFVPAGSKRIYSSEIEGISNVTFLTPAGKKVMIVLNSNTIAKGLNIKDKSRWAPVTIPENAVATLVW